MSKMDSMQKAFQYVDEHFDSSIEDLKTVCSYRSVASDSEGIQKTSEYIIQKLQSLGLNPEKYRNSSANPLTH